MPSRRAPTAVPSISSTKRYQSQPPSSAPVRALKNTYDALTAKENQSVVGAVGMFGVGLDLFIL